MLMVLVLWCYMAALSFVTGFSVLTLIGGRKEYRVRYVTSCMMAGLLILNVYAEYFSLFAGVGPSANAAAIVFVLAAAVLNGKRIAAFLKERAGETGRGRLLLYGFLVLLLAYGSSRGYMHYDTGLYHAQSIRWIEEYGVVPGLANLHSRFGYNSAAFALCALFGGAGLTKYPMHCVPGFFALLCAVKCAGLLDNRKEKKVRLTDFIYLSCIFYLVAVFRELVAPASDYFAMLILFFVLMCWTELFEKRVKDSLPYCLLSLCLVYAATVKLSAAVLLLLALYPAVLLIRRKKWKRILLFIFLGVGIAFPYLARNVLISGWLFYPFTFFDVFPVDWKIAKGYADSDAFEIQVYAKEIYDVYQKDLPFSVWFPNWFKSQQPLDRALVAAGWLSVPVCLAEIAVTAFGCAKEKKGGGRERFTRRTSKDALGGIGALELLLLLTAALAGFLFWQFGAPLVRYGYFYVLFLPVVTFGALYTGYLAAGRGRVLFQAVAAAFLLYRGYNLCNMITELWEQPYYIWQQDYGSYPAETYEVDGVTVYVPLDRGQIGYDKFPSSPVIQDIELRGETLEDGFRKRDRCEK